MKKLISLVLALVMVLSLAGCGATGKGEGAFTPDDEGNKGKTESSEEEETDTSESAKPEESESVPEETAEAPATTEGIWRMIDWANSDVQSRTDHMAFDEEYIYFHKGRCGAFGRNQRLTRTEKASIVWILRRWKGPWKRKSLI